MGPTTTHELRCPRCGAQARPEAAWCTLCYADLRPAEETAPRRAGETAPHRAGRRRKPVAAGAGESLPDAQVGAMLAQLAAESRAPLGSMMGRFESKGARVALMAGGVVAVSAVLFACMALLGSLL